MSKKTSFYSFQNVVAMVDDLRVIGSWDGDDAISITPIEDVGALLGGADGSSIFSQYAGEGVTISIKVQHMSPTDIQFEQIYRRQKDARGAQGVPLSVTDVRSGEGGSTDQAFIQSRPTVDYGKNATVRDWTFVVGAWDYNERTIA